MPTSANTIAQANRLLSDSTAANSGAVRANASVVATPVIEILAIGCDGNDCCEVANDPAPRRGDGSSDVGLVQAVVAGRVNSTACACTNSRMLVGAWPVSRVKSSVMRS